MLISHHYPSLYCRKDEQLENYTDFYQEMKLVPTGDPPKRNYGIFGTQKSQSYSDRASFLTTRL